jgi:hypothetical protein
MHKYYRNSEIWVGAYATTQLYLGPPLSMYVFPPPLISRNMSSLLCVIQPWNYEAHVIEDAMCATDRLGWEVTILILTNRQPDVLFIALVEEYKMYQVERKGN